MSSLTSGYRQLAGFTSAVLFDTHIAGIKDPVLHSGLTVIAPSKRHSSLLILLFARLFVDTVARYGRRVWITNLLEVPSALVHIYTFAQSVYPSPDLSTPSEKHAKIARIISEKYRSKMHIASSATFEEANFVFRGSNTDEDAEYFRKDVNNPKYWHLNRTANDFYRNLFRVMEGGEVLQVGFLDPEHIRQLKRKERFRGCYAVFDKVGGLRPELFLLLA
jgi:hypothetical protein